MAMQEIMIQSDYAQAKFTNKAIIDTTRLIEREGLNSRNSMLRICGAVGMLDQADLRSEGFASGWDYLAKVFGVKQSMARQMERVGKEFVREGKCILGDNMEWSITTLCALLPIKDHARQLVNEGRVTPTMTVKEVQRVVAEVKTPRKRKTSKHAAPVTILAIGPCIVEENGKRGISLDGGKTMKYPIDGLTDKTIRDKCYAAVREMLASIQ